MTEAEKIAAGLTDAQRRWVISMQEPNGRGKWPARHALVAKGLAIAWPWQLTPLCLEVRKVLEREASL